MQIMISEQFQVYMKNLGVDLNDALQKAGVNKVIWKESLDLNNSEYWRLMYEFDNELSDEAIISFLDINHINSFMPSFFAALVAKNGTEIVHQYIAGKSVHKKRLQDKCLKLSSVVFLHNFLSSKV